MDPKLVRTSNEKMIKEKLSSFEIDQEVKDFFEFEVANKTYKELLELGIEIVKNNSYPIETIFEDLERIRLVEVSHLLSHIKPENLPKG